MQKIQFYISFNEKENTAASKAIIDCKDILTRAGYEDYTIVANHTPGKGYFLPVFKALFKLFLMLKPGALVAIQYPLLSGNTLFKYFIKALHAKKVKFFCVIHDLDELRYKNGTNSKPGAEAQNLNFYDCVIVHNETMQRWLADAGVNVPMVPLKVFDYVIQNNNKPQAKDNGPGRTIAFAGNLSKSEFIYALGLLNNWQFNVYGPNFLADKGYNLPNLSWHGSFNTEKIVTKLEGSFGLIWDGKYIDRLDDQYGNYLRYNNPHKLSLYLAAGLPVIAPAGSAIASFIRKHSIGLLVDSLFDLKDMVIDELTYNLFKNNVIKVSKRIKQGEYLSEAIWDTEEILSAGQA